MKISTVIEKNDSYSLPFKLLNFNDLISILNEIEKLKHVTNSNKPTILLRFSTLFSTLITEENVIIKCIEEKLKLIHLSKNKLHSLLNF